MKLCNIEILYKAQGATGGIQFIKVNQYDKFNFFSFGFLSAYFNSC